jgi:hypothetical protein
MGIDGVDKKGPAVPNLPPIAGPTAQHRPEFVLGRVESASGTTQVHQPSSPTSLDQLRSGAITLGRYLDIQVEQATSHLTMLSPAELGSVRAALRDRLASDPALVDLVRAATGATPEPPRDE